MIRVAVLPALLALGACYGVDEIEGTWEPLDAQGTLMPEVGPRPSAVAPATGPLRVASFNTHFAEDPAGLARALLADEAMARADVIAIQEIEAYAREGTTRTQRLAEALGMTWIYVPARVEGDGTHGLAMLSRYPLVDVQVMRLPHADAAFNERDRIAVAAKVDLGDVLAPIINVHLDVRIGPIDRVRQLHPVVADAPEAVAVLGDFNTNPWAWIGSTVPLTGQEAILDQDQAEVIDHYLSGLGFDIAIARGEATFNVPLVGGRLDNVYPRGWALLDAGVARGVEGSDHWPVWADLAVR